MLQPISSSRARSAADRRRSVDVFEHLGSSLYHGDFLEVSKSWEPPTVIVVDGPYGVGEEVPPTFQSFSAVELDVSPPKLLTTSI